MKSSFCIDLQRFMLTPTKFPLSHYTHGVGFATTRLSHLILLSLIKAWSIYIKIKASDINKKKLQEFPEASL